MTPTPFYRSAAVNGLLAMITLIALLVLLTRDVTAPAFWGAVAGVLLWSFVARAVGAWQTAQAIVLFDRLIVPNPDPHLWAQVTTVRRARDHIEVIFRATNGEDLDTVLCLTDDEFAKLQQEPHA